MKLYIAHALLVLGFGFGILAGLSFALGSMNLFTMWLFGGIGILCALLIVLGLHLQSVWTKQPSTGDANGNDTQLPGMR